MGQTFDRMDVDKASYLAVVHVSWILLDNRDFQSFHAGQGKDVWPSPPLRNQPSALSVVKPNSTENN